MKYVTFFVSNLYGGGAERIMVTLANEFANRGYRVDLLLLNAEGPYLPEVSNKVKIVELRANRAIYSIFKIARYLRVKYPDAVFSTQSHINLVLLLAKIISKYKGKIIVREASIIFKPRKYNLKEKIILLLKRYLYHLADNVIVVSNQAKDEICLLGIPENKVSLIYNPVDIITIEKLASVNLSHPWFYEKIPVIISVGRLSEPKDYVTLIKAFALVVKKRKIRLMILGEGEDRVKIENLIQKLGLSDFIYMMGFVRNPFPYIKRSRVLVLSSKWEGFPNVLVQALALGTPVVATDCSSGPREILENGKFGELVPVGDDKAMAEAILKTMENFVDSTMLKRRAADFSLERIMPKYIDLLEYETVKK